MLTEAKEGEEKGCKEGAEERGGGMSKEEMLEQVRQDGRRRVSENGMLTGWGGGMKGRHQ